MQILMHAVQTSDVEEAASKRRAQIEEQEKAVAGAAAAHRDEGEAAPQNISTLSSVLSPTLPPYAKKLRPSGRTLNRLSPLR